MFPLIFVSYEFWFIFTMFVEVFWAFVKLEYWITDEKEDNNEHRRINGILAFPQVAGIISLVFFKTWSCLTRFDKYDLTNTLYIGFTTYLTNYIFSIPALIVVDFSFLDNEYVDGQKAKWVMAALIFVLGALSTTITYRLLKEIEDEEKEYYDNQYNNDTYFQKK